MGKNKSKNAKIVRKQSTQQQIPIKEIKEGIIITNDKKYIKILEVKPSQFFFKSSEEQNKITLEFNNLLKVLPTDTQFISMTLPADLSEQLAILERDIKKETKKKCLEMEKEFKTKLEEMQEFSTRRRFFIVFAHENFERKLFNNKDFYDICYDIELECNLIKNALENCGNKIIEVVPKSHYIKPGADYAISEILYTFLNRDKGFEDNLFAVNQRYYEKFGTPNYFIPPTDYLAPKRISFANSKYVIVNNLFYSYLYIPSNGYVQTVSTGWLNLFINTYNGVDVHVFLHREDKSIKKRISRNILYSRANANDVKDVSESYEESMKTLDASSYLKEGISNGQDFYYVSTLISVCGYTPEEVDAKIKSLKKIGEQNDITIKELKYDEEEAFKSCLPLCKLSDSIFNKAKRNVLTEGAASFYPFITSEVNDPDGIYFGDNLSNDSLAIIDVFDSRVFTNANIFLTGKSGAGKTFALSLMATRMRSKHIPVFILAPEKQHEFIRLCDALEGEYLQIGPGSNYKLNIMEITKRDESADLLDLNVEKASYLSTKIGTLTTFFKLLIPDLTVEEIAFLEEALVKTYHNFDITEDNNSIYDDEDIMRTKLKKMPIIADLRDVLKEKIETRRLANAINRLCMGSGACFNGQTNVDISNDFVVIGLETLEEDLLPLGIYVAMEYIWGKAKENRTKKKALLIDEWWKLAKNPVAADYSYKMAKLVRSYSMSMVLATQQLSDIKASGADNIGKAIIGNCSIKILMQMENSDIQTVDEILNLNNNQLNIIRRLSRGEALFTASNNDYQIKFQASENEFKLITTDRVATSKLLEEAKEKERNKVLNFDDVFIEG